MPRTINELRESFLTFFEEKGHRRQRSASLVPQNDPSLLFTNAGMVPFKDYFTGQESPEFKRATSCQRCLRAGGKHNDLESVGFTKRHLTFFEMLGNFSFGDYFKKEAMEFAWEYLTSRVGFDPKTLWVSVYEEDDEAFELWEKHIGVSKERIVRMGKEENFWSMGETGPCGPCSEIHYDRGEAFGKDETIFDGGERFLEVWNLVFMQYEAKADGQLINLPKPSVDTGMGLERLAALVQGVDSTYETDSMQNIMDGFANTLGVKTGQSKDIDVALKVLTDHIRSVSFLISDGIHPTNEGRGYVLRRILRRAVRYGKKLGCSAPFFSQGVSFLEKEMGAAYPELSNNQKMIEKVIHHEEMKFFETLEAGLKLLEAHLPGSGELDGSVAFQLYDTFGFPLDLTEMILRERGLSLDREGFDRALEKQKERSRRSWKGSGDSSVSEIYHQLSGDEYQTKFLGYESLESNAKVVGILAQGQQVDSISEEGQKARLILNQTPFYAESGGQVGDQGVIEFAEGRFFVEDTQSPREGMVIHIGTLNKGTIRKHDQVTARVDRDRRLKTRINHTITHVLHATLQEVLGEHVKQAGSLVHPDYLRFDFNHFQGLSREEIRNIEKIVNRRIRENPNISTSVENLDDAIAKGAKSFFGEKYGERVRVLCVGDFSIELCGGTHAQSLAEAGFFKITSESSVASGIRRIIAVTGEQAYEYITERESLIENLSQMLKSAPQELPERVQKLVKEKQELQKKRTQRPKAKKQDLQQKIQQINKINILVDIVDVSSPKELRPLADEYKMAVQKGVVLLGAKLDKKATVVVAVTKDIAADFQTNELVSKLGGILEGRGGGRDDFAQVGGSNVDGVQQEALFQVVKEHVEKLKLAS